MGSEVVRPRYDLSEKWFAVVPDPDDHPLNQVLRLVGVNPIEHVELGSFRQIWTHGLSFVVEMVDGQSRLDLAG